MEKEGYNMQMGMYMMENGKMIKLMVEELIHMQMGHDMRVNGNKIVSMEAELRHGLMALNIKDSIQKGKNTE